MFVSSSEVDESAALDRKQEFDSEEVIAEFEEKTKNAARVQRETLKRILEENGCTEYLNKFGLQGRTDPETFRSCVPLVTHSDLEPYIERIADGDTGPVLTGKPVTSFSLSSGTTNGKRKFLLFNDELVKTTMQTYLVSFAYRNREFPIGKGKALQFIYGSKQFLTKGGLVATTATTNVYRSEEFKTTMRAIQSHCCSPDEVIFGTDFSQCLYCHLLCGLICRDEVQAITATFAHSIVLAFQTFETIWEELCADIRIGVLSRKITIPTMRQAVSSLLQPNPDLADAIVRKVTSLSNWYGVIPALWPNVNYVYGIMTGSMEHYVTKLRHYAGELPLVSSEYGASEGWIGANVEPRIPPESAAFAVLPDIAYFEFIPLRDINRGKSSPEPIGLTEVQIGQEYEIVVTTFAGLYRYRLGDVVQVAGFHNSTPKLKFSCRRNLILNINIDKNTEKDLQLAVDGAAKLLAGEKLEVVDYSSYAEVSSNPGHYVIFWELNAFAKDEVLQSCCDYLDSAFLDPGYVGSRRTNGIGPLELRVVQRGTFESMLRSYLADGTAVSQFKTPRCIAPSNAKVMDILRRSDARSFFSKAYNKVA